MKEEPTLRLSICGPRLSSQAKATDGEGHPRLREPGGVELPFLWSFSLSTQESPPILLFRTVQSDEPQQERDDLRSGFRPISSNIHALSCGPSILSLQSWPSSGKVPRFLGPSLVDSHPNQFPIRPTEHEMYAAYSGIWDTVTTGVYKKSRPHEPRRCLIPNAWDLGAH